MTTNKQKEHFNNFLHDYLNNYYDKYSMIYREKFVHKNFMKNEFNNSKILEVGGFVGKNLEYLYKKNKGILKMDMIEISDECINNVKKNYSYINAYNLDFTKDISGNITEKYDIIFCFGVLHHMINKLDQVFKNIDILLKPNGKLIFWEPNGYFLTKLREKWYKKDKFFDETEEGPLKYDELYNKYFKNKFKKSSVVYFGGPAFFLVLSNVIFRIPHKLKKFYSLPLIYFDYLWNKLPLKKRLMASFYAEWEK